VRKQDHKTAILQFSPANGGQVVTDFVLIQDNLKFICIFVIMNIIEQNIDKLIELCLKHKVRELYIFGSILTDKFNDSSDIDFLVQFGRVDILEYFDNYMDFKEKLESLLNRSVDLIENQAIRNPIFRKIVDRDKKLVYERESA
jgi:predicted nucleotidyltransferase